MNFLTPRLVMVIAFLAIVLGAGEALAQTKVADVIALKCTTFVTSGGKTQALRIGGPIYQGDQLHSTAGCGAKLRFTDGSTLAIGENTVMTVHTYAQQGGNRTAIFEMIGGIFRAIVSPLAGDAVFAVRTPTAVAAVRSTDWMLSAKPDLTEVFVGEGAVAVRSLNPAITAEVMLLQGDGSDVKLNEPPLSARKWGPPRIKAFQDRTAID